MTTTTSFSDQKRFSQLYRVIFRRNIGYFSMYAVILFISVSYTHLDLLWQLYKYCHK